MFNVTKQLLYFSSILSITLIATDNNRFNNMSQSFEQKNIENLSRYILMTDKVKSDLYKLANADDSQVREITVPADQSIPLFSHYPILAKTIAYVSFCDLPTPIIYCKNLAQSLGIKHLYIKRDDLTGKKLPNGSRLFGGNKPRKLEFVLADALKNKVRSVLTFGCTGSNHATATATYCKELGLKCILMMKPQINSHIVRRNLLLDLAADAEIIHAPTNSLRSIAAVHVSVMHKQLHGSFPYVIPTGASCPLGVLGYINAVFELQDQINAGIIEEPKRIYIPLGSAGTMAGLILGAKAIGLKSKIVGITIEPEEEPHEFLNKLTKLFKETNEFLSQADSSFGTYSLTEDDFSILYDFCGKDYAEFTQDGVAAIALIKNTENITLDGVYSGKAFAGALADIKKNRLEHEPLLFWNTFCSDSFDELISSTDYHRLPVYLHSYFENDVQELDR